ncbi:MAG TPA: DUF4097 family beta strand repeat-containing protein, partial [Vicinamibacterales bacterium]
MTTAMSQTTRVVSRVVFVIGATAVSALPAAAQDPAGLHELVEQVTEQVRSLARVQANQAREQADQARDRARQAAQQERERAAAERRARAEARRGPEQTEMFSRTVRIGRNGTFDLSNVAGDIVVTGGGGEDVRIDAIKRVRGNEADAKALLQAIQIQVTERSGLVEVRTELPRRRNWSGGVDFTIALPNTANAALRTVSGDVRVSSVRGELRAETVSGDVIASQLGRLRSVRAVSGDILIEDAEGGELTAGTVSGDVIANGLRVKAIDLESVSGDVRFTDVESDRVSLRTINGDIEYSGRLARSGRYELQSHSGDIRLVPADNTGFDVDANTFSGDIRSDFQVRAGQVADAGARAVVSRSLRGAFGDASAILTLRSFNG